MILTSTICIISLAASYEKYMQQAKKIWLIFGMLYEEIWLLVFVYKFKVKACLLWVLKHDKFTTSQ